MSISTFMLGIILTIALSEVPPKCDSFEVTVEVENTSDGLKNGSIELTLKGGLGPHSFFWFGTNRRVVLDNPNEEDQYNLAPGRYYVVIQDKTCSESLEFEIE